MQNDRIIQMKRCSQFTPFPTSDVVRWDLEVTLAVFLSPLPQIYKKNSTNICTTTMQASAKRERCLRMPNRHYYYYYYVDRHHNNLQETLLSSSRILDFRFIWDVILTTGQIFWMLRTWPWANVVVHLFLYSFLIKESLYSKNILNARRPQSPQMVFSP